MTGGRTFSAAAGLILLATGAAGFAAPLRAQGVAASAAAAEPEPARLEAARRLIAVMVPPAQRDQMADAMAEPGMAAASADLMRYVEDEEKIIDKVGARATVESFFAERRPKLIAQFRGTIPGMMEQMARAHARLLTVEDLQAIEAFYRTPAGAAFARATPKMINEPEEANGQTQAMTAIIETLMRDIDAVKQHLIAAAAAGERK